MIHGMFTTIDIAKALQVSGMTIKRWVYWYQQEEHDSSIKLPPYRKVNGIRLWEASPKTIEGFKNFRRNLPRGTMSSYNAVRSWGQRGQQILDRKPR